MQVKQNDSKLNTHKLTTNKVQYYMLHKMKAVNYPALVDRKTVSYSCTCESMGNANVLGMSRGFIGYIFYS